MTDNRDHTETAGDQLDDIARALADRENIPYKVAFERACEAHPDLARRHVEASGERG